MKALRVLAVHGVGHQELDPASWQPLWTEAIESGIRIWQPERPVDLRFAAYDALFAEADLGAPTVLRALARLLGSLVVHGVPEWLRRERGVGRAPERLRWTAGMVALWIGRDALRRRVRLALAREARAHDADIIVAHSLGSLIAYDAFARDASLAMTSAGTPRALVTLGSQVGHAAVRASFAGRLKPLAPLAWYHLFNEHDDIFTARVRLPASHSFVEVDTPFDIEGIADHDAVRYLTHAQARAVVWRRLALLGTSAEARRLESAIASVVDPRSEDAPEAARDRGKRVRRTRTRKPRRRAVLIGINDYPDPKDRLEGCLNDVFLVSALLQEGGFDPDDIRVLLDARATRRTILDRISWLLDGAKAGDRLALFFSGHGAQIAGEGAGETIDRLDECLVPHDFDWTRDTAICDDDLCEFYSQLPYECQFLVWLDCCHSGGMTRDGGARPRGLAPPDDIRHRLLRWDARERMWRERALPKRFTLGAGASAEERKLYLGESGALVRLGRGTSVWTERGYDRERSALDHHGPFLPVIFQACDERELAFEYRHGVESYGAFTYALGVELRRAREKGRAPRYDDLVAMVRRKLRSLGYDQRPQIVGPSGVLSGRAALLT